jgi:hypothetical protein
MDNPYAINLNTNRLIKKTTAKYKKLYKLGRTREICDNDVGTPVPETAPPEPTEPEPVLTTTPPSSPTSPVHLKYTEEKLQRLLTEKSTDIIQQNLDRFSNTAKLSDQQLDDLVKQMLYQKLVGQEKPTKKTKKKVTITKPLKKKKYKLKKIQSSSEEESESD